MGREIKLHLGCGKRYIPGFVHIDLDGYPHIDYKSDISNLSMFEDNSVDLIYSSAALQYFDCDEIHQVLKEWNRVLKERGMLRISTANLAALMEVYDKYKDINLILGPLYGKMEIRMHDGTKLIYHKTVYDFESLKTVLEENGFENVRYYDWRKTIHKDYDDQSQAYIPHMDKKKGIHIMLNIEANKKRWFYELGNMD